MKSKLLLLVIAVVVLFAGSSAFAQDPNNADTIDFVLNVDTLAGKAVLQVWIYSDELVVGSTFGFTWANSPGDNLVLDSARALQFVDDGYDILFYYEDDNRATSNANQRALFGGALFVSPGVPADPSGRRQWLNYYFSMPQPWNGAIHGIEIDTLSYSAGSDYRFVTSGNVNFFPQFVGKVRYGDAGLGAGEGTSDLPKSYALSQNYPNPFNPTTEISFDIPTKSHVTLAIYNILGQKVATLIDRDMTPQKGHTVTWDASENATGIYFYKLTAGNFTETRKMMLLK